MNFVRFLVALLLAVPAWGWAVPSVQPGQADAHVNLAPLMAMDVMPAREALDPDTAWALPLRPPAVSRAPQWDVDAGQRVVGRVVLQGRRELEQFVLLVPSARMDEVRVWYRYGEAGSWKSAVAGDRGPLSHCPVVGPRPGFQVLLV